MVAADVMNTTPVMVTEDTPVLEVVSLLLDLQISAVPVLNSEGKMTGIITEGNLLRRSELGTEIKHSHWMELLLSSGKLARDFIQSHALYACNVMTPVPLTVKPQTSLVEIINLMENHRIKCVPVINGEKLAGIITQVDILKALRNMLEHQPVMNVTSYIKDDQSLEQSIVEKIERQPWVTQNSICIQVSQGEVTISGTIFSENLRKALMTLLEGFVDRRAIRDHLIFYQPTIGLIITPETKEQK